MNKRHNRFFRILRAIRYAKMRGAFVSDLLHEYKFYRYYSINV